MAQAQVKCPRCGQPVEASGEAVVDGQRFGVYQCDRCVVPWKVEGETFPSAFTFALDADGVAVDPIDFTPLPPAGQ